MQSFKRLSMKRRKEILAQYNDDETLIITYDWESIAREKQLEPPGEWRQWLIRSGRGFGKTRTGAEWIRKRAEERPDQKISIVGQTIADVRDTMLEMEESSLFNISPPWFMPEYVPNTFRKRIRWPNGAEAKLFSGDKPEQMRGQNVNSIWIDELAKFQYPERTWKNLNLCLRVGPNPRAIITTTPRPIPAIRTLLKHPKTIDVIGSSFENRANLSHEWLEEILYTYEGTRLGRQEIYGELLTDTPGALWKMSDIDRNRVTEEEVPDLESVCVAVDPAATSTETSSKTGIIVKGRGGPPKGRENGHPNHYYTLADGTLHGSPQQWATAAIRLYYKYEANCIVVEVNHGGDMIKHTLSTVDPNVKVVEVRASRGKYTRAEPIAALAEQGRDHHVGTFAALEDQQTTWLPGDESPDEMDADVWGTTHLMSIRSIDYWIPEG